MALQARLLEYRDGAQSCQGYLAWDDSIAGPRPGVAIAHTWAGRTEFECDKARRLAALGYMGFALDMYGEGSQGGSPAGNAALMQPLMNDRATLQRRHHGIASPAGSRSPANRRHGLLLRRSLRAGPCPK